MINSFLIISQPLSCSSPSWSSIVYSNSDVFDIQLELLKIKMLVCIINETHCEFFKFSYQRRKTFFLSRNLIFSVCQRRVIYFLISWRPLFSLKKSKKKNNRLAKIIKKKPKESSKKCEYICIMIIQDRAKLRRRRRGRENHRHTRVMTQSLTYQFLQVRQSSVLTLCMFVEMFLFEKVYECGMRHLPKYIQPIVNITIFVNLIIKAR